MNWKRMKANLQATIEEHPLEALAVGAAVATVATKLIQASTEARNSRTWEKEVERRRYNTMR